jgi:hypothetical protein
MRSTALFVALLAAFTATADVQYDGVAYDLSDGKTVIYRESHFYDASDDGSGTRIVLYRCPSGEPFARKRVDYVTRAAPSFELIDARLDYREGVRANGQGREVFVQYRDEDEEAGPLPKDDGLVADAGFDNFVQQNWDALQRGETVRFPFLVPSRLDSWNFKVKKSASTTVEGEPASIIRLALGSWFAFLLPSIDVTYIDARRELVRFEGISNLRDVEGDNYKARIEFDPADREPLDPAAMRAAESSPLAESCRT